MTKDQYRTILNGLFPDGCDMKNLTPLGRKELRAALDAVCDLREASKALIAQEEA